MEPSTQWNVGSRWLSRPWQPSNKHVKSRAMADLVLADSSSVSASFWFPGFYAVACPSVCACVVIWSDRYKRMTVWGSQIAPFVGGLSPVFLCGPRSHMRPRRRIWRTLASSSVRLYATIIQKSIVHRLLMRNVIRPHCWNIYQFPVQCASIAEMLLVDKRLEQYFCYC